MAGKQEVPTKPELVRHGNGQRVIRYPFKTKKGTSVVRIYKLGWADDKEADRQFGIFATHWSRMNGKGPEAVIEKMAKHPIKGKPGTALKIRTAEDEKATAELEKRRKYARDHYHEKQARKKAGPQANELDSVVDLIGVIVSSLGAINTSLKMLQDKITALQQQR